MSAKVLPLFLGIFLLLFGSPVDVCAAEKANTTDKFVHPGLLHTRGSLDTMREQVTRGREPWKASFENFRKEAQASFDYRMRGPFEMVSRIPHVNNRQADADFKAAYYNAIMWAITGDGRHAAKSREILNAYATGLRGYSKDDHDRQLTASLGPFLLVNAAEIIRYTDAGWPDEDIARFETFLKSVVLPSIRDFATFANGNWDTGCVKTTLAIGVFCDDREVFDRGIGYFRNGKGNGRLTYYIINEAGQCQESGRDQQHVQLGLGHLAEAAEMAFHQGIDLYGESDNRLLRGFEYTARYNLGEEVPFQQHVDTTGKYKHKSISEEGRGELRPIYEMVWNHYRHRKGIDAPYTGRAAAMLRPEGAMTKNADHPGYGTLFFTIPETRETRNVGRSK